LAEGCFVKAYDRLLTEACLDGEHVKPPLGIIQVASTKKLPRHARQVAALLVIDCVFRPRLA
jgi:hypothetical protein